MCPAGSEEGRGLRFPPSPRREQSCLAAKEPLSVLAPEEGAGAARVPPPEEGSPAGMALDGHRDGPGALMLVRVPGVILTQPFGRRTAPGSRRKEALLAGRSSLFTSVV